MQLHINYKVRIGFFILIAQFITKHSFAQENVLTYEEAISIAITNNITYKQQQNNLKISHAEKAQSMANFLPSVEAGGRGYRTDGRQWSNEESAMVNTSIDRAYYSIGAEMTVFNGLKNMHQLKQANEFLEAQEKQVLQSKHDVVFNTSRQFLQILLDKELLLIAEKDFEVQKKLYDQLDAYVSTGVRTKSELLSQEAQMKASEVAVLSGENRLRSSKAELAKILQFDPEYRFTLISPEWKVEDILQLDLRIDSLFEEALSSRPELKVLQAQKEANKEQIQISRAEYMPQLSIYYNYGSEYSSNYRRLNTADSLFYEISLKDQLLRENFSHQCGFVVRVPLFTKLQTRTNVIRAKVNYENSMLAHSNFKTQLYIDVQNAYLDLLAYQKTYLANKKRLSAASLAYEKQKELYEMGLGSLVELTVENQRFIKANAEEIRSKFMLVFQKIALDYYIGKLS